MHRPLVPNPHTGLPPLPDDLLNETSPITTPPERLPLLTQSALEQQENAKAIGDVAGTATLGLTLLGGASASSAPGNLMVISGIECRSEMDDSDKMDRLLHPLGFRIEGVAGAGAIVGNVLLWGGVSAVFTATVRLLQALGFGTTRGAEEATPWQRSAAALRYPSVLLPIPMLLFAGVVPPAFDIIFNRHESVVVSVIGVFGLIASLAFVGVLWHVSPVPEAHVEGVRGRPLLQRIFLGKSEWVSHSQKPLYVERYGIVFDVHNHLPWVKGKYFALELLPLYPIAALVSIRSSDWGVCVFKVSATAFVMLVCSWVTIAKQVFHVPFLTVVVASSNILMAVGLLLYAVAYSLHDMHHWTIELAQFAFTIAMVVCLLRALYDLCTFMRDLCGCDSRVKGLTLDDIPLDAVAEPSDMQPAQEPSPMQQKQRMLSEAETSLLGNEVFPTPGRSPGSSFVFSHTLSPRSVELANASGNTSSFRRSRYSGGRSALGSGLGWADTVSSVRSSDDGAHPLQQQSPTRKRASTGRGVHAVQRRGVSLPPAGSAHVSR